MKKLILILLGLTLMNCSSDDSEQRNEEQCDCVKTFYLYYPAMGNGSSYIPAHYDVVDQQVGNFDCEDETNDYVSDSHAQYSHYKINCD